MMIVIILFLLLVGLAALFSFSTVALNKTTEKVDSPPSKMLDAVPAIESPEDALNREGLERQFDAPHPNGKYPDKLDFVRDMGWPGAETRDPSMVPVDGTTIPFKRFF
jgi:hypothetical protein